ncbi:cilia- and flagella-associated protein 99-like isoform X2 [Gigantopelta aegis]|nr:cilia- and flagella-associated protein 99-like isoform X2 [Gigantopelta aegis]
MLKMLNNKMENEKKPKVVTQAQTECQPFDLTQPKPKSIPLPEPIPKLQKHNPVPKTLYRDPTEFDKLSKIKQINRHQAEERLMESSRYQFACANPEKSNKTKEKLHNIVMKEESKLEFDKKKALPKPAFLHKEVPVKLNAATILRDGIRYKKLEEKEMDRYKKLEAGARDPRHFEEWQSEMRQKDIEAQLADIERRRLIGKLSHEEAILARQNVVMENKKTVQAMKEETQRMMKEYFEKKFQEEQEIKQLLENTMQGHKNAKEAKKKLQEYNQRIVQEVNEESRELMKRALEEAEADMRRKMELIQQIRAMEAVPVMRQKFVDLTATSGQGLLSEMSIAELRERLALLKVANEEAEELKRDEILESKQNKDQLLLDTLETISKHRTEEMRAAAMRLEEKKKKKSQRPEIKDEKLLELQRRLEEKRLARIEAQQKSKITPTPESVEHTRRIVSQKQRLEESRWFELEQSRERTAKLASKGIASSKTGRKLTPPDSFVMAS